MKTNSKLYHNFFTPNSWRTSVKLTVNWFHELFFKLETLICYNFYFISYFSKDVPEEIVMKCTRNSFCEKEVEKVFCQGQSNPIFKTLRSALEPSSRKRVEVAEMRRIWCLHQRPWQKVRKNGLFCTRTTESILTNSNLTKIILLYVPCIIVYFYRYHNLRNQILNVLFIHWIY